MIWYILGVIAVTIIQIFVYIMIAKKQKTMKQTNKKNKYSLDDMIIYEQNKKINNQEDLWNK
ncbi:MAG: hypothetical protein RBR48_01915 [Bacilli bacterium]|jgi:hypothetical protein|nr:hypothetical protein [Bacilli bacterium]MDD3348707.1 hypothetical protein [Bacilli bacterium]MDD4056643.1 hypothetical protein [Bacilli bacterium]MDY0208923.1 hypothetical protein [Bacilli bacterium]